MVQLSHPHVTACKSLQSCLTLCDLMECSLPSTPLHGILQARILKWIAMPSSRGSSQPKDQTRISYVSCIGRWVLYHQCHLGSPVVLTQNKVGDVSGILCTSTAGGMGLIPGWGTNLPPMQETQVQCLGQEDPLEKGMATHSSILPGESHGQRSLAESMGS